ncbi:MAG: quinone-dependent dihydroorotate dehydrogenase [Candidatus Pelagibacterales bacterium]|jgi:dihydroorotate dehydrogenase
MDNLLISLLRKFEPETAHDISIKLLKFAPILFNKFRHELLEQEIVGLKFQNPVGMAAGYDKNAEVFESLFKIGFGFVECGTVTPLPQYGNPKPRVFRHIEESALINSLGFNNKGINSFLNGVQKRTDFDSPLGINIGPNKDTKNFIDDYTILINKAHDFADYITVNISSPNTENLRKLQDKTALEELISNLVASLKDKKVQKPIFIKINPDEESNNYSDIINLISKYSIAGLIISNTTIQREQNLSPQIRKQDGGLSGKPLLKKSNEILELVFRETQGSIILIGVGGISSGGEAYQKIKLGASLIQLYSAFTFQGPNLINKINKELVQLAKKDGFNSISEAVGSGL